MTTNTSAAPPAPVVNPPAGDVPAGTPVPTGQEVTEGGPGTPLTITEAKQYLRSLRQKPNVPEAGTPAESTEGTPAEAAEEAPKEGDTVATGKEEGAQGEIAKPEAAAVDSAPEGVVVLDIPEGHPLRDRGKTQLPPIPKEWEPEFRNFLNDPIRRADLARLESEASQHRQEKMQWERVAGFYVDKLQKLLSDPTVAVQAAELRAERGDDVANAYIEHVLNQDEGAIRDLLAQTQKEFQQTEIQRTTVAFVERAVPAMQKHFPMLGEARAGSILQAYFNELDAGRYPSPTWPTLKSFVSQYYETLPEVVQARGRAQQEAADKKRLEEEAQRKAAEEAVTAHQARVEHNPLGRLPKVTSSQATTGTPQTPGNVNVRDLKKQLRYGR